MRYYNDYVSPELISSLKKEPVHGVKGLFQVGKGSGLETKESHQFLTQLFLLVREPLNKILEQRMKDRKFLDERVAACYEFNKNLGRDYLSNEYQTVLGLEDAQGRIVIGPKNSNYSQSGGKKIAPIPEHLKGSHITLFGPPDNAKMAINAMNAYHRKLKNEPPIIEELLASQSDVPKWGADDEDSKTPLREDLIDAAVNLTACFERTIQLEENGKKYELAKDHLAVPMKRFPGLALPCSFLFFEDTPIPLHLYDFALHLFANWKNPEALTFYVPKLENEEEARYIHFMVTTAEQLVQSLHPEYVLGTVRLMIVLENPRAILRTHEIIDELYPYFVGASLGWHDYLASTARLFKEDGNYRIPVKADPDIVIKYIKASHRMLADVVGSRGGIKVGGMYGILPLDNQEESFQATLKGFFKDVIIQLKRDLTGFWVAHPDFVRLGLAIAEAWKQYSLGSETALRTLIAELVKPSYQQEILTFIEKDDIQGLDTDSPEYVRSLIVADIKESDFIPNNHPDEIRYNVFQSLQYLTDWLSGNGCVALPAVVNGVAVRVMDDLATAERSRWEVWHEIYHKRFSLEDFLVIVHEEMNFIRRDLSDSKKIVQVKWNEKSAKWYPVAKHLMIQLMTSRRPVEFATELLMPFTIDAIRNADDPLIAIQKFESKKYALEEEVQRFDYYFERCGSLRFARAMAKNPVVDIDGAKNIILSFSLEEILQAASFHGNIGESKKTLDGLAAREQSKAHQSGASVLNDLKSQGDEYLEKFGFKFLVSAQDKTAEDLLHILKNRLNNSLEKELDNARNALWEITLRRFHSAPLDNLKNKLEALRAKYQVRGAQIVLTTKNSIQNLSIGRRDQKNLVDDSTYFELASLSKSITAIFAMEFFRNNRISLNSKVNTLFDKTDSTFRLSSPANPEWANRVEIQHLLNHTALNMHYVCGFALGDRPAAIDILTSPEKFGYEALAIVNEPGKVFQYSGGGYLVLEHLLETLSGQPIEKLAADFFQQLDIEGLSFIESESNKIYANGFDENGKEIAGGRLSFPASAAGALGSADGMAQFLQKIASAYQNIRGVVGISHDTAVRALQGVDHGSRNFMGCYMGLGIFIVEAGENRFSVHQGANDGFRCLYLHCFSGPDFGKGLVIFCNADNQGVLFIAEAAQEIIRTLGVSGVDVSRFLDGFDFSAITQEQIVNLGYKALLFDAFQLDLPEPILVKGPLDPWADKNILTGAKIEFVSNQKFARAENLISNHLPVFDPELFGRQGKVMDSWETARHNPSRIEKLVLRVKKLSAISCLQISTKFHDGNQAEFIRLCGRIGNDEWQEFLPKVKLDGHALLKIRLEKATPVYSEIKVEMFPDGGVTRLGLYSDQLLGEEFQALAAAKPVRFSDPIPKTAKPLTIPYLGPVEKPHPQMDFASVAYGGKLVRATNEHYGPAAQVISPFPPLHMFDGLESARSRGADKNRFEEVQIALAKPTVISEIVLNFKYFVNNNPVAVEIDGFANGKWEPLICRTEVKAFAGLEKLFSISDQRIFSELKLRTYPDGGINRINVFAVPNTTL